MDAIKVLDHGHVRLVEHMGNDLSIVRNARVSYDAEWRAGDDDGKDAKLIAYLWNNKHTIRHTIAANSRMMHGVYQSLIGQGCPRELARSVLPVGTYTHFFGTVNLLNLFRFLILRLHEHAQYEIRVYAQAMLQLIEPVVPVAVAAFRDARPS